MTAVVMYRRNFEHPLPELRRFHTYSGQNMYGNGANQQYGQNMYGNGANQQYGQNMYGNGTNQQYGQNMYGNGAAQGGDAPFPYMF